jgi:hypothetical protein
MHKIPGGLLSFLKSAPLMRTLAIIKLIFFTYWHDVPRMTEKGAKITSPDKALQNLGLS